MYRAELGIHPGRENGAVREEDFVVGVLRGLIEIFHAPLCGVQVFGVLCLGIGHVLQPCNAGRAAALSPESIRTGSWVLKL